MISSVNSSQRQATFVRSFFLTITADGGSPDGGALEMQKMVKDMFKLLRLVEELLVVHSL